MANDLPSLSASSGAPPRRTRSALGVVYGTVFVDLLGFGIILPLLPYYAERFGATGVWVGAILSAYSVAQFIGSPVLGRLSDRVGRRPILLLSLAGSATSLCMTGVADGLGMLLLARAAAGAFGGSIATAQAYVADVTLPHERAKFMGFLGASIGMGFVFGPGLGALLSRYGFGTAAFVAAGFAALNLVVALFALKESRPREERTAAARGQLTLGAVRRSLAHPGAARIVFAMFLATFAFVAMEATYPLLGEVRYGLDDASLGWTLVYVGVVVVFIQGGLIGRLVARWGERATAVRGALIMGLALALLPFAPSLGGSLLVLGMLAGGQGLVSPTLSTLLSRHADVDDQGGTLGVGQGMAALARAVGPLLAGALYDIEPSAPYALAAAAMALAAHVLSGIGQMPVARVVTSAPPAAP